MTSMPSLADKYDLTQERIYLTGTQAMVRLLLAQRAADRAHGLNTAGFVTGYRGSPFGTYDRELWRASHELKQADVQFWPAVNEDLAATALWGSQLVHMRPDRRVDGVFGVWYGKGAGLDRSSDVFRHANSAGTAPQGGVLVAVGDDHALKSSTNPYHCEPTFADLLMPLLAPATLEEIVPFGLHGFALSRFSGLWTGLKLLPEHLDASGSLDDHWARVQPILPVEDAPPPGGVSTRWPDPWPAGEERLVRLKLPAARAYARANELNRIVLDAPRPRLGIFAAGKAWADLLQALEDMGLDEARCRGLGLRLCKIGMPWPLDGVTMRSFANGLERVLVVEEKRPFIEEQLKAALYELAEGARPAVIGKQQADGSWLLPWSGSVGPDAIALALAEVLGRDALPERGLARLALIDQAQRRAAAASTTRRTPYFCSGCPHNTSTKVPEGSVAMTGVGCHGMAMDMDRATSGLVQMGGEGAPWIGLAPFVKDGHIFANLGDGTWFHSGSLAVRACVAAGVNITFKILFNDAVAMTGGQPHDGRVSVAAIVANLLAEGVARVEVLSETPEIHAPGSLPSGIVVRHRDELDGIQRELRTLSGVTAIVYDQTCAAEKRRRRKRGEYPDPPRRAFINELVCEGCGDCGVKSNCVSVVPVETEFGRKRRIDQSSCNKDLSCIKGFCPSFVTVEGGRPRRGRAQDVLLPPMLPEPVRRVGERCDIFIAGVGGTGVITIGALLGMAAHIEGRSVRVIDVLGMAQKGGAVTSHVRLAPAGVAVHGPFVANGATDVILACDLLVAGGAEALAKIAPGRTTVIANVHQTITGRFTRDPDATLPLGQIAAQLQREAGADRYDAHDFTGIATRLVGDSIASNLFILGFAFQRGLVPLGLASLEMAIRLNGVSVDTSLRTFALGRQAALDPTLLAVPQDGPVVAQGLDELRRRHMAFLRDYQNDAYAARYAALLDDVAAAEIAALPGSTRFSQVVARYAFKLMAYKDEYEVARLYAAPAYREALHGAFEGEYRLRYHLAPPLLSKPDPVTGEPRKISFGPWMGTALRLLSKGRVLRGTPFDPFGYTDERRSERAEMEAYFAVVMELAQGLTPAKLDAACEIAAYPEQIRGYGPVKARNRAAALRRRDDLLARWRMPAASLPPAAAA